MRIEEYLLNTFQTQTVISKKYQILKKAALFFGQPLTLKTRNK